TSQALDGAEAVIGVELAAPVDHEGRVLPASIEIVRDRLGHRVVLRALRLEPAVHLLAGIALVRGHRGRETSLVFADGGFDVVRAPGIPEHGAQSLVSDAAGERAWTVGSEQVETVLARELDGRPV